MTKIQNFKFLVVVFSFSFLVFNFAQAAVLYLEPSEGEFYQGDTFIVSARVDTEQDCINAVEANLSFPQDILEAVDFSQGDSILSFWVKSPVVDNDSGIVSFAGGIPGGYCGTLPGDPGESNLLGKIIFQVKEAGGGEVKFLESSQVLLNDGIGTPAILTAKKATLTLSPGGLETPKQEWQEELEKDRTPPEVFEIEINQEPATFEGKYFITFQTQDKQTGIDYYEVKEGKRDWKRGDSPYLLEDQSLKSIIKVKAVDKAGNERIVEYRLAEKFSLWWLIPILIGIAVIWRLIKKFIVRI